MESKINLRKRIYLIGTSSHQLVGCKLPSTVHHQWSAATDGFPSSAVFELPAFLNIFDKRLLKAVRGSLSVRFMGEWML